MEAPPPPQNPALTVYSVGHSNRTVAELAFLLAEHGVRLLVDVRTAPRSRANPQFNKDALPAALASQPGGPGYEWMGKALGGLRSRNKALGDTNAGWHTAAFQAYADYMQAPEFRAGVDALLALAARRGPVALMCAETCYWQCHRCLLCDYLHAVRGCTVRHIMAPGKPLLEHRLTAFARLQGGRLTYPAGPQDEHAQQRQQQAGSGQRAIDGFFKPGGSTAQPQEEAAVERDDAARQAEEGRQAGAGAKQAQQQVLQRAQQLQPPQPPQQPSAMPSGQGSKPGAGQQRLDSFFRKQTQEERQRVQEEEARHWRQQQQQQQQQRRQQQPAKSAVGIAAYFQPRPKRSKSGGDNA